MALPPKVNLGTAPNNGTGDKLRVAFDKLNVRDEYLEGLISGIKQTQIVSSLPPSPQTDTLYANVTDQTLQIYDGTDWVQFGGGEVTYQIVIDALGYVPEPELGNPVSDGMVLSSTAAGVRSWVVQEAGGGGVTQQYVDDADAATLALAQAYTDGLLGGKEDVANKAEDFTTVNNTLYPTLQAVVNYLNAQGFITDYTVTLSDVTNALGFTPENVANKATTLTTSNNTLYPTVKAVLDYLQAQGYITSYTVTEQDVISALGFNPADQTDLDTLDDRVDETELDITFLNENAIRGIRDSEGNLIAPNAQMEVELPPSTGGIQSIQPGANVTVDVTDPLNPIVSASGGGGDESYLVAHTIDVTTAGENQVFTLPDEYFFIQTVFERIYLKRDIEWEGLPPNQIRIVPLLEVGDVVEVQYWVNSTSNFPISDNEVIQKIAPILFSENEEVISENLFNPAEIYEDKLIASNGALVDLPDYSISGFIPVTPGGDYRLNSDRSIAFYFSLTGDIDQPSDDFLGPLDSTISMDIREITIPLGVNFLRFGFKSPWKYDLFFISLPEVDSVEKSFFTTDNIKHRGEYLIDMFSDKKQGPTEIPKAYSLRKPISNAAITEDYIYAGIGDKIVRYGLDEIEETITTIPGAAHWRCLWRHSSGSIFASPIDDPGNLMDENAYGLYKIDGTTVTKVIDAGYRENIWGIDEDSQGNIYAGLYIQTGVFNATVYKSTDGGVTFNIVFQPDIEHVHALFCDKTNDNVYVCCGDDYGGKLNYKTEDEGVTWYEIASQPINQFTDVIATETCRLFGSDQNPYGQIYRTTDDVHFELVLDTHYQNVFWLRQSDITGYVYAGFKLDPSAISDYYTDIWYSKNDGKNWELLKRVENLQVSDGFWFASRFFEGNLIAGLVENGAYVNAMGITESSQHFYSSDGIEGTKIKPLQKV